MNAASKRARWARGLRARDSEYNSVNSSSTLDDSSQDLHHPSEVSTKPQHKKRDAGSYKAFKEERKHDNGKLTPEQTANGTDFTGIQVPEGAPADLVCEECERRDAVGYCELCEEVLCAVCLAITHIPSTGGQAHMHFSQEGLRTLRAGDESTVMRIEDDPIPAHQIDEEEMATRRDLSVSSSLDAPTIDFTSRTAPRNAATPLHAKGQLVVFQASLADSLPDRLAGDDDDAGDGDGDGDGDAVSAWQVLQPRELYGEVMSVPMARHGRWGHAGRRAQGHRLLLRVKVLGRASRPYSEPFVEEWLHRQYRREVPREPVQISGGSGADPLAREIGLAKVKDRQREDIKRTMVLPENELPMSRPPGQPVHSASTEEGGRDDDRFLARGGRPANNANRGKDAGVDNAETTSLVILIAEDELFAVEAKREELRKHRCSLLQACRKSAERRQAAVGALAALGRWHNHIVEARKTRQQWASQVLQRRVRGTLVRLRLERQREAEEKALWDAGRRLHKQFRYLDTEELRKAAGGGVTTNGQVFVGTKAELNRLEALRKVMAEKSYRMLCKGVHHAKVRAFRHWLRHTEWVGRNNEAYVFSVAKDACLAGDELQEPASYETDWRHPSHGIEIPPLPPLYCERLKAKEKEKLSSAASASAVKRMAGPAPFCSWLIPGLVLISSYLDAEAKARPREFKQPPHPDAASQIVIAGVGTLICLTSQEVVRQHESDSDLPPFDQVFEVSHKVISADTKVRFAETKHEVMIMRQEEKKMQTQTVGGQDQEERRKELAEVVSRMRIARSAFDAAQQASDRFPKQLRVAWDPFPEDEALGVDDVVEFAVRLEDRLRAGEKLCLWTPRGHGRVGLVGAVLLGRLYGCTAEDAILRVQACHDARESLKGQPQISCPQTIAQVQCVREVLLQMSSMYTDLTMRADLPASTRGVQVCRSVRGEGPPSLRQPICVPDETQSNRYKREKARRAQMDATQDDCNSTPSTANTNTNPKALPTARGDGAALFEDDSSGTLKGGETESQCPVESTVGSETRSGKLSPRDGTTVSRGFHGGGVKAGREVLLLPPLKGKGSGRHQPPRERARAVAAVPYPTMRSLRLT